jgi:hypothetical protein
VAVLGRQGRDRIRLSHRSCRMNAFPHELRRSVQPEERIDDGRPHRR